MSAHSGGDFASGGSVRKETFASVLERSIVPSLNRNVLEVILEKDLKGSFIVTESECAKFLSKLGLNLSSGHVEAVQICPNGRGVLYITLKENIEISNYCRYDVIDIAPSGIRAVHVRPAGKRDVTVNIKGIHPNTKDEIVLDYLEKFGKLVTRKVVYGIFRDGPLKGLKNGDRNYRMEIKPGTNLGSYHILDGQKVTIRYPGQQQTCGRCLRIATECSGRGIAKKCEAAGGVRQDFVDYINDLWKAIDYSPNWNRQEYTSSESSEDIDLQIGGEFTPIK